ncbi:MAG: PAS domain-containing sensor histidine kinase [Bacteroidota bacterium]|nr:PAS domain-containing sensor histidine kinase [Bacteroidota bacterium]
MDVLKDILDNLNDSVITLDSRGQILMFNNEALRIQKSISEKPIRIGDYFTEIVSEARKPVVADILKTLKRQRKPVKNFAECSTPFGSSVYLEVNFIPVYGPKKELKYVNVISQDITSRKVFEKKLRASSEHFSNLLDNAHAFIFSVDSRGYVVDWNNHCAELTGYSKKEILSCRVSEFLIKQEHLRVFTELMERLLQNESVGNCELPVQTRNGAEIIVMTSATPRTNANGQVVGATLVGHDVTELTNYRRSLERQVENQTAELAQVLKKEKEAVELKSRFVSIASHEFRSPLSSIDFAASFIKQNAATIGKKKLNEKVEVIEKHVNHMSHLLEDVLNYSRNESAKIKIIPAKIDLDGFVRDTVEEVMCLCKHSHHICVSTNKLGSLLTDEKLLRNVLINLLSNAVKFSPGREEVLLNVLDEGQFVTVEVSDEGIGISRNELEVIFQPFIRGKSADEFPGTGLGLSIVKKAVELLQGSIRVKSRPGRGSVFKVIIPRLRLVA